MNHRTQPEAGWNLLLAFSLAGILVAGWFAFLQPKPHRFASGSRQPSVAAIEAETREIEAKASEGGKRLSDRTWDVGPELFGSQLLDKTTAIAGKCHLRLTNFRVGKTFAAAGLRETPVTVVVDGGFMDVMAFMAALEKPDSKIAVSQLDLSASGIQDQVSATVSIAGFLSQEKM